MNLTSRLNRIGRLAIAPVKGFFSLKTETVGPDFEPGRGTWGAYLKAVVRQDIAQFFEPFKFAVRAFREERAKG